MSLSLVVLAAGLGTRFGGAKQLAGLGPSGETLLDYNLFDAARAGFDRVVLVIRAELRREMEEVASRWRRRLPVQLVEQSPADLPPGSEPVNRERPWGTGQAVWSARRAVSGPFAVANADDCYGPAAFAVLGRFLGERTSAEPRYALVGYRLGDTLPAQGAVNRAALNIDSGGRLIRVEEIEGIDRRNAPSLEMLVSMNLWGFTPVVFPQLEAGLRKFAAQHRDDPRAEHPLPTAVDELIASGHAVVEVLPSQGRWCGVTHSEDRETVAAFLAEQVTSGAYPRDLYA